jgi:hypothetical protein
VLVRRTARFVEVTAAWLTPYRVTAARDLGFTTLPWLFFSTLVAQSIALRHQAGNAIDLTAGEGDDHYLPHCARPPVTVLQG